MKSVIFGSILSILPQSLYIDPPRSEPREIILSVRKNVGELIAKFERGEVLECIFPKNGLLSISNSGKDGLFLGKTDGTNITISLSPFRLANDSTKKIGDTNGTGFNTTSLLNCE